MERDMIWAGFGGQGVQLASLLLTAAAAKVGKKALHYSSYSSEVRGGVITCTVIVNDDATEEIYSPLVSDAWGLITMNRRALDQFENAVKPGGVLLVNSSIVPRKTERHDVTALYVPCNDIAKEVGDERTISMIALGALLEKTGIVPVDVAIKSVEDILPPHRKGLVSINQKAIARGAAFVREGKA